MKLEGERLSLRPFGPGDLAHTLAWVRDPEVSRWLLPAWPLPLSWAAWLTQVYNSPNALHFAIVLKDGRYIGNCSLHTIRWAGRTAGVGVFLGEKDCWGQGYAPEALRVLLRYAFGPLGLRRVILRAHRENRRARKAYKKAGFVEVSEPPALRWLRLKKEPDLVTMVAQARTWMEVPWP